MGIEVYSAPGCVQCRSTKKKLDSLGLEYNVIDISKNEDYYREYLSKEGFTQLPVVKTVNGSFSGFRPEKLNSLAY